MNSLDKVALAAGLLWLSDGAGHVTHDWRFFVAVFCFLVFGAASFVESIRGSK